jgi:endoglucanase
VRIEVEASDSDGKVTGIAFYADGAQIGTSTSATATLRWELSSGPHTLTAVATDNSGAKTTSSAVAITVR